MKKAALALTAFLVSVSCLQSSAWSTSSLLMQMPAILAASQKSDTTQILIGENGVITVFKGKTLRSNIKIYHGYALADSTTYEYSTVTGPSGLSVSADGVISYAVPASADTQSIPLSLQVKEKGTGKSYTKDVQLVIMATEIIASGTVGPTGGKIADELEEVVVTVPEGAVEGQTLIEVLRAVDENGYYTYTINASAPLLKILQMRLPDPILRKASEESLAALQSKKAFQQSPRMEKQLSMATASNSRWFNWHFWSARYIEITTGINAENRLRNDLPDNLEPEHPDIIHNTYSDAAELLSLCSHDAYNTQCGSKDPVVFIHGYTTGGELGGGVDTWGKLPELIAAEGYAVFEFKWRTNARFEDVAANFADAIKLIQEKSHKKVHIIAHSFGGLVSRAYLQNYALGRPYQDNVQSLLTLGTPHSGIFDSDGTYHDFYFKKGQDSNLFEGCLQISCQEAGEPTPDAWTIKQLFGFGPDISMSSYFGINTNPGELIAKIQNVSGIHTVPVDVNTLIGIYVNRQPLDSTNWKYSNGDGLITYAGQRFSMTWGDNKIHADPEKFNSISVSEKILGITDNDSDAVPFKEVSQEIFDKWHLGIFSIFVGYFHSPSIPSYFINEFVGPYRYRVAAEAYVDVCTDAQGNIITCENFYSTNAPHAALTEIKTWLKSKSSEVAEPTNITMNLKVVDADTQQPVSEAEIYFDIGSSCTAVPYFTDAAGNLSVTLPFYPAAHYKALVRADGYRSDEFDTGYVTGATPELSGTEFGTIRLQKGKIPTVTSATGRIWMDRNLGASRVATSMTDTEAYGDLYQWGRGKDGHEKRTSGTIATLSSTDNPGHSSFITTTSEPFDWRSPQNDTLWQGAAGVNNPCPSGFRLPTEAEWQAEIDSWSSKNAAGALASPLKLVLPGMRTYPAGSILDTGLKGAYWSSTIDSTSPNKSIKYLLVQNDSGAIHTNPRAYGFSARCIKDDRDYLKANKHIISGNESVRFDYDFNGTNCSIDFTDGTPPVSLSRCTGSIDHVFTKEWVYGVNLYSNTELVDKESIIIQNPTNEWIGFVISSYYEDNENTNDIIQNGRMYISPSLSPTNYYWTVFRYVNPDLFKTVNGDDFSIEAKIKVPESEGGISCYDPSLGVTGEGGAVALVRFMAPGCTYYSVIGAADWWHDGGSSGCATCETKDLSVLGKDFSDWRIVKLKVKDGYVSAYYDNELLYSMQYKGKVGNIYGLQQTFKGSGSVDWIKLYDGSGNLVYSDDFNR